jgi:tetratricopeptide (TPR) repeat protein
MRLLSYAGAALILAACVVGCRDKEATSQAAAPTAPSTPPTASAPVPMPLVPAPVNTAQTADRTPLSQRMVEFHDSGQMLQAIGAANRVIKNGGPSVAKAYYIRGSAEGQMREFALAVQDLKSATEREPSNDQAWFSRAWYEYEAGDLDQAISTGEKAVELSPRSAMAWLNLGLCYAVKNNVPKAKRCYEAGHRLSNRGIIGEAMRDIDNARQRYPKSEKTLNQAMKWITGE